ncbi:cephalosporin-C deacetylase [Ereboglobus sp. PH5-5]|uniref:acetylxylan esterase n=1 Tax=Ereboglobus sp. PH5-5 TaxID=2940529 RepID=UPI00240775DA|nr:alpha/beta fold hydrolase [Ereboglobus sp. PH5-5]MDF9833839.1 cephalosporin-C deacetylase [Ereboglobus sp. PH5-5]
MPLTFDKPLPELRKYRGTNPRPADFDAYWRAALRELDATPANAELVPNRAIAPAGVECFDLWFDGTHGARIHAKYLRPERTPENTDKRHPAVLLFHGYSGHSGDWQDKLAIVSQGFCVAAMDVRGQGGLSEDTGGVKGNTLRGQIIRGLDDPDPHRLFFRDVFLDTAQLARAVMTFPEVDEKRVGATGWSQGGALTLACAALEPRIKRAAPVYPFLCDYQRVWQMDQAKDAYDELRYFFRQHDPLHEREEAIFTKLGYIDCQHHAHRIKARIMLGIGLMDTVCPPSTQFAAYNKIKSKKQMVIYPDFAHEPLPGMHDKIFELMRGL